MSLEQINYFSQIISTLAVVASLIFVGLQLRQSAKATRLSAYEAAQGRLDNTRQAILSDPALAETFSKGLADPMLLDDRELVRFRLLLFVAANALETLHTMFVQSHIGASEWNKVKPTALRIFATPGGRAWLALFKDEIDPKLAKVLNELVESKPISGMPSRAGWEAALASNKTA